MPHPYITNHSPYVVEPLIVPDEEGRYVLAPIVKGTFELRTTDREGRRGTLVVADDPAPICFAGEFWGEPETSSYRLEPETAFTKPGTDVVLIGTSLPPKDASATEQRVGFRVGSIQKMARVVGDRVWVKKLGRIRPSKPEPVGAVPLIAERAFGGGPLAAESGKPKYETRNPVGRGFRVPRDEWEDDIPLPNVELVNESLKSYGQRVTPALFGFTSPSWEPRVRYAGTFDEKWEKERKPLLPRDFDRMYFSGAPADQFCAEYLRGDEKVALVNVGRREQIEFALPGLPAPKVAAWLGGRGRVELAMNLDTVIIDADRDRVSLIWRQHVPLRDGPLDFSKMTIEAVTSPREAAHR